jgi:hypothetical protein
MEEMILEALTLVSIKIRVLDIAPYSLVDRYQCLMSNMLPNLEYSAVKTEAATLLGNIATYLPNYTALPSRRL